MKYYRISEVAQMLRCSKQSIYMLVRKNQINVHELGHMYLIDEKEYKLLEDALDLNKKTHKFKKRKEIQNVNTD